MIVTLAGHVDHGKTSLVRALTGVDTDSLAEEKRRGLTIDLGFAYAEIAGKRIGFVDVPGHHRFIHNMIAGIASQQCALVVVAADDGPMPQTEEHVAILRMLGVTDGILAITKIDRVEPTRVAVVAQSTAEWVAKAGLRVRATVPTSSVTGVGVDDLRRHIASIAETRKSESSERAFRLAIDRAFVIKGAGIVVTGTVHSGNLARGDDIMVAPRGIAARVRALHVSDRAADNTTVGDRCAVNIAGISLEQVARGDWLVAPSTFAPAHNVIVQLSVLSNFPRWVKHWLPVHVYHATSHAEGHVALLDSPPLAAGEAGLVELVLSTALHPKHGDRLVLRDHALERTIGGGTVIDIGAPEKTRRAPARIARFNAQRSDEVIRAFTELLDLGDVDIDAFKRTRNLTEAELAGLLTSANPQRLVRAGRGFAVPRQRWQAGLNALAVQIAAYHKTAPYSPGLKADQIQRLALVPKPWLEPALAELVASGRVRETGGHFFAPGHRPQLPPDDAALLKRIEALIKPGDRPPSTGDIAKTLGVALRTIEAFVVRMAKLGLLVRLGTNRVLLPSRLDVFVQLAQRLAEKNSAGFSAREFRDAAGIGRNLTIDVLEYFDQCGFTRRYGDLRRIVGASSTLQRA